MPSAPVVLSVLFSPRGRTSRRAYALGLLAVPLGCLLAAPFGPFALFGVAAVAWVFLCISARRLRDIGWPGLLAVIPFIVAISLGVSAIWFSLVTKGWCQGYCAGARASDIAALDWIERSAAPVIGWTFLAFVALLLAIPGRR